MAKTKLQAKVSFNKFQNDDRTFLFIESRSNDKEDFELDTAYPVENKMISANVFNLLQRYYDLGADVIFEL